MSDVDHTEAGDRQADLAEFTNTPPDRRCSDAPSADVDALRYGVERNAEHIGDLAELLGSIIAESHRSPNPAGTETSEYGDGPPADGSGEHHLIGYR